MPIQLLSAKRVTNSIDCIWREIFITMVKVIWRKVTSLVCIRAPILVDGKVVEGQPWFYSAVPFEHNARTWQTATDRQTDHGTVTHVAMGEIAYHRCRLKTVCHTRRHLAVKVFYFYNKRATTHNVSLLPYRNATLFHQVFWRLFDVSCSLRCYCIARSRGCRRISACGRSWTARNRRCSSKRHRKASSWCWTATTRSWWSRQWSTTTSNATVTWCRSEDCSTAKDTASARE